MAKAKQPVSIAGIEFDALISEDKTLEATVPEYSVESGTVISDNIILKPLRLQMVLYVTNTPVTWLKKHGSSKTRVSSICKKLENLYFKGEPVTVVTSDATYKNMAIESISISKSFEQGYSREIPISFKKINVTATKTTTIPASYGKSGTTKSSSGTANTSKSSTTSNSSSSSSKGSSGKTDEKKGSILYNTSKSLGIIK